MPDNIQTNFKDNNGVDLGSKLITKDYLISVYPGIVENLGISPELWGWGGNGSNFILGTGDTITRSTPVTTFAGGFRWKQISSSDFLTAAIKTDGTLWTWGVGTQGQLGNADITARSTPITTFAGGTNWKQVSAGSIHVAAIKTDGTLWVWGSFDLLGNGIGVNYDPNNVVQTIISTPVTTFTGGTNWRQVSAGRFATAAIKTDGTLWTWGPAGEGNQVAKRSILGHEKIINTISTPITTFAGGTNWANITETELYTLSSGGKYTTAIKTDGTLWSWGYVNTSRLGINDTTAIRRSTPVTTFAGGTNWKQVSAGYSHTSAIKTDGTLWVWGRNYAMQLGDNSINASASTPVTTFAGGTNWKQVSNGYNHTSAIKTDGTLWVWGNNNRGRLGINSTIIRISTPVTTFAGGTNWKQVSCGHSNVAAIKTNGTLWIWGNNSLGAIGINSLIDTSTPVTTFAGGTNWKNISCGGYHTLAIKTDGTLWSWGFNGSGRLGTNTITNALTPVTTFAGGTNWKQVSGGLEHTAAVKTDGTLWSWGRNSNFSQLGINSNVDKSTPVTTFAGGTTWEQVSCGYNHTSAIANDLISRRLFIFGGNDSGQLGDSTITTKSTPVTTFTGGTNWANILDTLEEDLYTITGSRFHAAAIKTDGTLWTWGNNTTGQLGNNKVELVLSSPGSTPSTTFAGGTDWRQVSSNSHFSSFYTLATKTDGTLWAWGQNNLGQLGFPTNYISTPITTFAGGNNWADTPTTNPEDLYTLTEGTSFSAAIKTDGTLWTWGVGNSGQLGSGGLLTSLIVSTPITTFSGGTNWKQINAGGDYVAAVKTDGTLWTWGAGGNGRLGNATTLTRSTPVTTFAGGTDWKQASASGGGSNISAVKTDGTLWMWGFGTSGRLGNATILGNVSTPVTTFAGGTNWKQVSSNLNHTAAVKTDGTLWAWGNPIGGTLGNAVITGSISTPVTTFIGGVDWKQVSSGSGFTSAVKTDGTLWIWGGGVNGALGNGVTTGNISTPVTTFAGGTNWKQVSAGSIHAAAIKTDGTLWTWGAGGNGRLGNAATSNRSTPVTTFAGGTNWKQASAGPSHTLALRDDGVNKQLWLFGENSANQLGNFITTIVAPAKVSNDTNWKQISAGDLFAGAIKTDGTLWTWGRGSNGALGNRDTLTNRSTPVTTFAGGTNWKQISCGYNKFVSAIKTDGTLWTWGNNSGGVLGINSNFGSRSTPVTTFAGGTNWRQVSSGGYHTAAIKTDGTLWVWGNNLTGKLGNGTNFNEVFTPITTFAGGTNWKQVAAGSRYTAAIKTDGTLWTWGFNGFGELGSGIFQGYGQGNVSTPITTFAGGTNWSQVFCPQYSLTSGFDGNASQYIIAMKTDGTLWTWGRNATSELGMFNNLYVPVLQSNATNWKQVSMGELHASAVKTDGTLWTWGRNTNKTLGDPNMSSGYNTYGYIAVDPRVRFTPITTFVGGTNWKQVSSGYNQTAAVKTDGTLWMWGNNNYGQLGRALDGIGKQFRGNIDSPLEVNPGENWNDTQIINLEDLYTISVQDTRFNGESNSFYAIKKNGTLWVWGGGNYGQLGNALRLGAQADTPSTTFAGGTNWKQISTTYGSSAAVKTDGTLWVWGKNYDGELGINSLGTRSTPVTTFAGGTNWKQVSVGYGVMGAVKTDGTLWTWGNSGSLNGALGRYSINYFDAIVSTPITTFTGGNNWADTPTTNAEDLYTLSAGGAFASFYSGPNSVAIKTDGTLWTWGYSNAKIHPLPRYIDQNYNQLGVDGICDENGRLPGTLSFNSDPYTGKRITTTSGSGTVTPIANNLLGPASLTIDETLQPPFGGYDDGFWVLELPFNISFNGKTYRRVCPTTNHMLTFGEGHRGLSLSVENPSLPKIMITATDGSVHRLCYGPEGTAPNRTYRIRCEGTYMISDDLDNPNMVYEITFYENVPNQIDIQIGENQNKILDVGDSLKANYISIPTTTFAGGTNWKQVSAGDNHAAAVKTDGTLWMWGDTYYGKLGNAPSVLSGGSGGRTTYIRSTPITTFAGGINWRQVSCGNEHTAAVKTDGTLWTWGTYRNGQLGDATEFNFRVFTSTPVTTFAGGTNWRQVSSGNRCTAAIKTDGTLWGWGRATFGRLGTNDTGVSPNRSTPVTTFAGGTDWKQVSNGYNCMAAVKTDGTLWLWGLTNEGQLGTGEIFSPTLQSYKLTPITTFAGGTNWKQVSVGNRHVGAIKTDGTLWVWGNGLKGQLGNTNTISNVSTPITTFVGGTNWKQVSCGDSHTLALRDDGVNKQLYVFGTGSLGVQLGNNHTPATTFAGGTNWKQVYMDSGGSAIKTDGTLWTWGSNNGGQLGTGDRTNRSTPVTTFTGGTNWKYTESGIALKTDGTLWTWGRQTAGDLARSYFDYRPSPVTTFAGGNNWADTPTTNPEDLYTMATSLTMCSAIKTDGTLWVWGNGQFGLGTAATSSTITGISTPVTTFAGGTNWIQVSCSNFSNNPTTTLAIKTDGTLWTWGYNGGNGILGNASTISLSTPSTTFAGGTNWKQVSAGMRHVGAVKTDGTLWTWGAGGNGRLGNATTLTRSTPVTTFAGGTDWRQVSAGYDYMAAVKTDGTLWTWGRGTAGRLGNAITSNTSVSTPITTFAGGTNWKQVSAGNAHMAAVKTDGTLWTWGRNQFYGTLQGQLGNNATTNVSTPVTTFAGGTNWKQVSTGGPSGSHTTAVKTDGTLWTWGDNNSGKLGTNDTITRLTPVTTFAGGTSWKQVNGGGSFTVALKDDGVNKQLWLFGTNTSTQLGLFVDERNIPLTTFAGGTDWKSINYKSAIKTDGTLWTWGGTRSIPATLYGGNNWSQTKIINNSNVALKTDGTLWIWGFSETAYSKIMRYENAIPKTTFVGGTNWKQVSTGYDHTTAIKTDGTLWTWGQSGPELGIADIFSTMYTPVTTFAGETNWKQVIASTSGNTIALKSEEF